MLETLARRMEIVQRELAEIKRCFRYLYERSLPPKPAFTPRHDPDWESKLPRKPLTTHK